MTERLRSAADWAVYHPQVRFDAYVERAEYERLFKHPASALQDRLVRLGAVIEPKKSL